eukprot:gene18685-18984_t
MEASTKPSNTHIGRKISRIRELRGIKQETLASELGVSQQTVSRMEQAETIEDEVLKKVAEVLGVSPEDVTILPQLDKACGLDMHKDKIVGFISCKDGSGQELKEFGTFTCELKDVKAWLQGHHVEHCLMESTGIYWMSLYAILTEAGIHVTVANPTHIKQVPKRKTDRKDAKWLCTLLLNGLVRPSFMPTAEQRILRDHCRSRLFYMRQQNKTQNRLLKILETAGVTDKQQLIACALGRVKLKKEGLSKALDGTLAPHHLVQLQMLLQDLDHVAKQLETSAQIILSEAGSDMSRFNTADHLTAWCGLAPGNHESAGKRRETSVKKGNPYLKTAIITAAWAAVRVKDSYWRALFERLRKRMRVQKVIVAIARRMLKVVYKTLDTLTHYQEKGIAHFMDLQEKAA